MSLSGLAALATQFAFAFTVVKFAGCAYLIYLAWKIWHTPVHITDIKRVNVATDPWPSFIGSLTLCLGNPKVIVFFISIMPLVIDVKQVTLISYFAMLIVMAPFVPLLTFSVLYLAKRVRLVFQSTTALRQINRGSAVLMAGAATVIGLKA